MSRQGPDGHFEICTKAHGSRHRRGARGACVSVRRSRSRGPGGGRRGGRKSALGGGNAARQEENRGWGAAGALERICERRSGITRLAQIRQNLPTPTGTTRFFQMDTFRQGHCLTARHCGAASSAAVAGAASHLTYLHDAVQPPPGPAEPTPAVARGPRWSSNCPPSRPDAAVKTAGCQAPHGTCYCPAQSARSLPHDTRFPPAPRAARQAATPAPWTAPHPRARGMHPIAGRPAPDTAAVRGCMKSGYRDTARPRWWLQGHRASRAATRSMSAVMRDPCWSTLALAACRRPAYCTSTFMRRDSSCSTVFLSAPPASCTHPPP